MADAEIHDVLPYLNKKKGTNKHFTLAIKGKNFASGIKVTVKLVKGTKTYNWELDGSNIHIHTSDLMVVRLKRKDSDTDDEKGVDVFRQIEQITVTVQNTGQAMAAELPNVDALIVDV